MNFYSLLLLHCFNIFTTFLPHIMKVGGSLYLLQNGMDDSPMCGNEFPGKIFPPNPNQLTLWQFES